MADKITGDMVVRALKELGRSVQVVHIAQHLGTTDTRAIATAARKPAADGRIRVTYKKRGATAWYRFVRLTPRPAGQQEENGNG